MKPITITQEAFLKDVQHHKLVVYLNDGWFRHIRAANPESSIHSFEVTTWPGYLAFTGDMGSYVFRRIPDMFSFFRKAEGEKDLIITPSYWAEKLEAIDRYDGFEQWDSDIFRELAEEWLDDWLKTEPGALFSEDDVRNLVKEEVFAHLDDCDAGMAYSRLLGISLEMPDSSGYRLQPFQDFWEVKANAYAPRYIWACYAIVWLIDQYDNGNVTLKTGD